MVSKFKGLATAKYETDFGKNREIVGTPAWQPPEVPEWTSRGEVWVIAAICLSLCRLLPRGPIRPAPDDYRGSVVWNETADARKGIRDMGTGPTYSQQMEDLIRNCLRFTRDNRPLSYELMVKIRKAEMETIGEQQIPIQPLPPWALKNG